MNDLRLAARHLFKSPGFTLVAVVTLAVGVAATASLFSVIKSLVLDPLPYPDSQRVGQIWAKNAGAILDFMPLSTPDFLDLQEQLTSFEAIGAFSPRRFNLGGDKPESVEGALCTPGVFPAFGVAPLLGRWFTAEDVASRDGASVVIISHALWRQRFAANPGCLGRSLRLDGRDYIVVGVMPEQFELLSMWTRDRTLSLWLPLALSRANRNRGNLWMSSVARLKPDASPDRARAELEAAGGRLATLAPDTNARRTFWFMPLQQGLGGLPALRISVLLGAGWTLLVLAGQNVAAMMLARGISRQSEIAVRIALGASRLRIVRLVLAESLLLAALAGGLGFLGGRSVFGNGRFVGIVGPVGGDAPALADFGGAGIHLVGNGAFLIDVFSQFHVVVADGGLARIVASGEEQNRTGKGKNGFGGNGGRAHGASFRR